jgi:hypothetical protein
MKKAALFSVVLGMFMTMVAGASMLVPTALVADTLPPNPPSGTKTGNLSIPFQVPNPLKGTSDLPTFIQKVLQGMVLLLTPVVVIMLLYSGFLFVIARGNIEKLGEAKNALMYTMIGAAIVLGAEGFALVIQNTVGCLGGNANC